MKENKNIIILRESNLESIIQDGFTFIMLLSVILISYLMNSQAIGWIGAIMFFLATLSRWVLQREYYTVAEARAKLDEIEAKIKN